jgi:sugar phosphate isomerase/epimerase
LSLHQITAMDAGPAGLVSIAAEAGCDGVCIFTHIPTGVDKALFPAVDEANKGALWAVMRDRNVAVSNVEFFPITATAKNADFCAGLALGAELGAARAVCHIHDAQRERAVETLGNLADMAAGYGLSLGLEFMGMTAGCRSLDQAVWFVDQVARPNLGIAIDMLHLVRTGGTAADVAALDAAYISYAQICDGHGVHRSTEYMEEAFGRAMPGDGDFPVLAIVEALPPGCPLDVEVPCSNPAEHNTTTYEWAREAISRSRALISRADVRR